MATLEQFARKMQTRGARLVPRATQIKKQVGVAVVTAVVKATPHDTGRARHSWNVAMNHSNYSYEYDSFNTYSRTGDWFPKMATSRVAILRATEKDVIYISNGLPYIGRLNRGHSRQAPRDYVRIASIVGSNVVKQSRLLR